MGDSRGPEFEAVLITFLVLTFLTVTARCYTRLFLVRIFAFEDWLAVITFILYVGFFVAASMSIKHGNGSHVVDVSLPEREKAIMWRWIAITFYIVVSGLTKLIVSLFLLRVCIRQRWQKITLWTIIIIMSVYTAFYAILNINSCSPIQHEWERYGVEPIDLTGCNGPLLGTIPTYISAFLNVIVDWVLAILPASVLWNLKMERKLKITTYIVLALGSIASVASIVRIPYASGFLVSPDYLYTFTNLGIWSTIEIGMGLAASSLATCKPLFRKLRLLTTGTTHGSTSGGGGGHGPGGMGGAAGRYYHAGHQSDGNAYELPKSGTGGFRGSHQVHVVGGYGQPPLSADDKFLKGLDAESDYGVRDVSIQKEVSTTSIV